VPGEPVPVKVPEIGLYSSTLEIEKKELPPATPHLSMTCPDQAKAL